MEQALEKTLKTYYWCPNGFGTDEFYKDYIEFCNEIGSEPRAKSIVIRDVLSATGLKIKRRMIEQKYFTED